MAKRGRPKGRKKGQNDYTRIKKAIMIVLKAIARKQIKHILD